MLRFPNNVLDKTLTPLYIRHAQHLVGWFHLAPPPLSLSLCSQSSYYGPYQCQWWCDPCHAQNQSRLPSRLTQLSHRSSPTWPRPVPVVQEVAVHQPDSTGRRLRSSRTIACLIFKSIVFTCLSLCLSVSLSLSSLSLSLSLSFSLSVSLSLCLSVSLSLSLSLFSLSLSLSPPSLPHHHRFFFVVFFPWQCPIF